MHTIHLTPTRFTQVDDYDYDTLIAMGQWHANSSGYAVLYTHDPDGKRRVLYLHRVIMQLVTGNPVGRMQVDHINADRLDNRRDNLRLATPSENQAFKRSQINSHSGHKGITLRDGKYDVRLRYYHHRLHLGRYPDEDFDLAVAVYGYVHRILWGEFTSEGQGDVKLPTAIQDKLDIQIAAVLKVVSPS